MQEPPSPTGTIAPLSRAYFAFIGRTTLTLVLLTTCYYLLPVGQLMSAGAAGVRWAGVLLAFGGFVMILRYQITEGRLGLTVRARAEALVTALYVLILVFALVYNQIALRAPEQFDGIGDQTDALYFTVTVVATVGFGDVTAVGSAARALVTVQMLVNLIYIGTALRVLGATMTLPPVGRRPE